MSEAHDHIPIERDHHTVTVVEAVPPTWRDVPAILRGSYEPKVRKAEIPTQAAISQAWRGTPPASDDGAENAAP